MKKAFLFIALVSFCTGALIAQQEQQKSTDALTPREHIRALAGNTLLVRLPSNKKKIQAIEASLENDALSDKARVRLTSLLESTKEETKDMHDNYTEAFKNEYTFSEVGFFYDYDTPAILEGWGHVYNHDLSSEMKVPQDGAIYILSIGKTPDSRLDGLVVLDHQLDPVPRPFPNNVLTSGFAAIGAWFSGDPSESYFVRKLQKSLQRFFERSK